MSTIKTDLNTGVGLLKTAWGKTAEWYNKIEHAHSYYENFFEDRGIKGKDKEEKDYYDKTTD